MPTDTPDPGERPATTGPEAADDAAVPTRETLEALDADRWATVLATLRRDLADREELTDAQRTVLESPTSRLVGGDGRRRTIALLTGDAALWGRLRAQPGGEDLPVGGQGTGPSPTSATGSDTATGAGPVGDDAGAGTTRLRAQLERSRARARRGREDRDRWQRRAEGAEARGERLAAELAAARDRVAELEDDLAAAERRLTSAETERVRAVDRERRRRDAEVVRLEAELTALRRELDERRRRRPVDAAEPARAVPPPARPAVEPEPGGLRIGRPSRLPSDVAPGTTEAAELLLHAGRRVLVDGYNVTLQHRGHLDLEAQRTWLVQLLATAVARRRIRPLVVFDGERAGGRRSGVGRRGVEVAFTPTGVTADDELVLAVEATDEPVVVVTDDRDLARRVAAADADVLGTVPFVGAIGS